MIQGALERTGRSLDLAIQGRGFFMVQAAAANRSEIAYTRNGHFFVNAKNEVVLELRNDGWRLFPRITIPADASDVWVGQDGSVSYVGPGTSEHRNLGQIQLAQFRNPGALTRDEKRSLFLANEHSGPAGLSNPGERGAGSIAQGFLELGGRVCRRSDVTR